MLNWFLSRKKQTQKLEAMSKKYLIVGLGNIGQDYIKYIMQTHQSMHQIIRTFRIK